MEGGAGLILFDGNFPADGSHGNFALQVGVGIMCKIAPQLHLMTGLRYQHISNAGRTDDNPGYDSAMIYGGLVYEF